MRVVAGEFGGRVIDSPSEKTTRPTTDRVRESMFSSIYSRLADLSGTRVLDAFAGSGALGIEALSRGAQRAVFFERDANARKVLEGNLSSLGLRPPRATVAGRDVVSDAAAGAVLLGGAPYGLVLMDPPYALKPSEVHAFVRDLLSGGALAPGAVIVYEHAIANRQSAADAFGADATFEVTGQKKYGKIGVTYVKCLGA